MHRLLRSCLHVSGTHTGDVVLVAHGLREQSVADLPREDGRTLALVLGNLLHDLGRGDSRLTAADGAGPDRARLVVAAEDLAHAAVRHLQDAGDVTGPGAAVCELHDPLTGRVRQRTAVDEHTAQLVDTAVA